MTGQQGAWVVTPTGALFLATNTDIRQGLGDSLLKTPVALRISPEDIRADTKLMGLMRAGLVQTVAQTVGFDHNDRTVWETKEYTGKTIPQGTFALYKSLQSYRAEGLPTRTQQRSFAMPFMAISTTMFTTMT
jgi:hypothetical protein